MRRLRESSLSPGFAGGVLRIMSDIPDIATRRLRLTALTDRHFDCYAAMLANPACTRWVGDGRPLDRMNAWRSMAMLLGHWHLRGFGMWAVEHLEDGHFIGRVGLMYPEGWPDVALGWMLNPDDRHHGYATEAAAASLKFAWHHCRLQRVISLVRHGNEDSCHVAERLGGKCIDERDFCGSPTYVYAYYAPNH
ncbi:MAG TPA: GNAT family N-acetyltransferase [Rhodanobacteraceae bacterium]